MSGNLSALTHRLSRLRMAALGYRYIYDRANDERVVETIWSDMAGHLEQPDGRRRRFARAIAQYRAQLTMRPWLSVWLFEGACFIALPLFVVGSWLARVMQRKQKHTTACDGVQLVHGRRWRTNPEIFVIPESLEGDKVITRPLAHHRLTGHDVNTLIALLRYAVSLRTPFPFQFVLKCAVDIATVRAAILPYSCTYVLVYWEFSCSLSVITQTLTDSGMETYNVMHGDKNYYAKHAFFEVDRCYCWNDFYADLFKQEHVLAEFPLFTNPAFVLADADRQQLERDPPQGVGIAAPHLATLAARNLDRGAAAQAFAQAVNAAADGAAVTIRPHPFYTDDFDALAPHFTSDVTIAPPDTEPARAFILRHTVIVGTLSTILLEAAHIGKRVVIISTPATADLESYHFLYTMKNVTLSSIDGLAETIAAIDAQEKLGQTVARTRPASSTGTQ